MEKLLQEKATDLLTEKEKDLQLLTEARGLLEKVNDIIPGTYV